MSDAPETTEFRRPTEAELAKAKRIAKERSKAGLPMPVPVFDPPHKPQTTPTRIQRKRSKGWVMPSNTVAVDRSTPFGNPFPVAKCASTSMGVTKPIWVVGTWSGPAMWFRYTKEEAAKLSVDAFRAWLEQPQQEALREKARMALRGKNLACRCPLDQPCHADVLLEIANA
jgi:hypothetical protein